MIEFHKNAVKTIKMDANRQIVMSVFESIQVLLSRCAVYLKANYNDFKKYLETLQNLIIETFQNKVGVLIHFIIFSNY